MAAPWYNVFVGAETGLLKGINVVKSYWDNLNSLQAADKEKEITCMLWTNDDESEICAGLKNKEAFLLNTKTNTIADRFVLDCGSGKLKGLVKYDDRYITATDTGRVNVWENGESTTEIKGGENLHCLRQNSNNPKQLGTGGKENELKLWDVNQPEKPMFTAKNVKNDWLNLQVPVWVMDIGFLPENKIVTCTGHHQVRVYDPKAQRRPVLDMEFDEYPLTSMALCPLDTTKIIVGNTQGKMAILDVRVGKMVQIYKGFAGGIRSVQCHKSKSIVASCGLDRFVRIHDINSRELLHKVYLKSRLNCVLLTEQWQQDIDQKTDADDVKKPDVLDDDEVSEKSDDELWDAMDVVKTRTVKKSGQVNTTEVTKKRKKEPSSVPKVKKKKLKSFKQKET